MLFCYGGYNLEQYLGVPSLPRAEYLQSWSLRNWVATLKNGIFYSMRTEPGALNGRSSRCCWLVPEVAVTPALMGSCLFFLTSPHLISCRKTSKILKTQWVDFNFKLIWPHVRVNYLWYYVWSCRVSGYHHFLWRAVVMSIFCL